MGNMDWTPGPRHGVFPYPRIFLGAARITLGAGGCGRGDGSPMRNISESIAVPSCVNPTWPSRILRFTWVFAVLWGALLWGAGQSAGAAVPESYRVTLGWDGSPSADVAGYRVHFGSVSGDYPSHIDVGGATSITVPGLASGVIYFFAVTAYNSDGVESGFSNEVRFLPGLHSSRIGVLATGEVVLKMNGIIGHSYDIEATEDLTKWTKIASVTVGDGGLVEFQDPNAANFPKRFYRTRDLQP